MINKIFNKYKKIIMYLFFGVCTTLVNIISYFIMSHILNMSVMFSTIVAWILAVLFAYFTNRKWVFDSKAITKQEIIRELVSFFACRLATGIVDWLCMFIFVEKLGFNDLIIKIISNIIVIILNYVASKLIVFTDKKGKIDNKELIVYISFILVAFVFLLNSPLHIWRGLDIGTDSSVFKTVALMMQNGFMPYVHTFDHKGPLIYIYNYLGNIISSYRGVWIFELISLWVTLCYLFKIARLKCDRTVSYIITILSLSLLFKFFEYGNMTEEYALPFITGSLYVFLDYIINNKVNNRRLILCGMSFGAVLLLRPNMIATWVVFCLFILINCIRSKKIADLKRFVLYFVIGLLIPIIPAVVWLALNGALGEFWNAYIVFNSAYSQIVTSPGTTRFIKVWNSLFNFINNSTILASFVITILLIKENKNNVIYLIYMIVSLLFICLSGREYMHYMTIYIPIIVYPFAILFEHFNSTKNDSNKLVKLIVIVYLVSNIIIPSWMKTIKEIPKSYYQKDQNNISLDVSNIVKVIDDNTEPVDKISVYGNFDIYYVVSNRMHATKYSYQYPIGKVLPSIIDEYFDQLREEKPKIIVVEAGMYNDRIKDFLNNNNYRLIYGSIDENKAMVFKLNVDMSIKE